MRTVTHIPRSWQHSRMVIRMSSLMFFRRDWQSAWIAIINPFVFVCRLYLSIGEDAWLQPKRMTILHAFYSPLYHCQCLPDCECPLGFWNGDAVQLNELNAFMLSTVLVHKTVQTCTRINDQRMSVVRYLSRIRVYCRTFFCTYMV
jgi:hypothetical protein